MAIESTEYGNLIGSDKVEGTAVYGADGEKIGSIERVMIDKKSGQVSYAVLGFGGFERPGEHGLENGIIAEGRKDGLTRQAELDFAIHFDDRSAEVGVVAVGHLQLGLVILLPVEPDGRRG